MRNSLYQILFSLILLISLLHASATPASAQAGAANQLPGETIEIRLGDEIEVKALADLVSQRLGIRILYDEQVLNKKITIRSPGKIPVASLLALLQSALKMKDLALVDAEIEGWKRIDQASKLAQIAPISDVSEAIKRFGESTAVTQVFLLKNTDPTQVDLSIKPFLTATGSNSLPLKDLGTLIVTDYAINMLKVAKLIELIDQPRPEISIEFLPVEHVDAQVMSQQISQLLTGRKGRPGSGASGRSTPTPPGASQATTSNITHDVRTNQVIVTGTQQTIDEVKGLIAALDVALEATTKVYALKYVSGQRVDQIIQTLIGELAATRYKSAMDEESNLLFVTAPAEIHKQLDSLTEMLDVENARTPNPIKFYKLKNVTSFELLETLRAIEDGGVPSRRRRRSTTDGRIRGVREGFGPSGPNSGPRYPSEILLPPPPGFEARGQSPEANQPSGPTAFDSSQLRLPTSQAQITADESTNSLIVVGDPEVQRAYAELIRELDQRRAQVMIEAKLVILDASDDFVLGVEVSGGDRIGLKRIFGFTSFGLSNINPVTGALSIIPGTGLNGTLVDPDIADVVLRSLTQHRRARVMSVPRILVNDNATGLLTSVQEQPFTSVNASNVVATTSFAGFAEAGTTIEVTPHIGDANHLQLEYRIILNSFTGEGSEGVPPPRQTNELESEITIPDGHTVIVGGLRLTNAAEQVDSFPFIEKIPILRRLASLDDKSGQDTVLYVFLRPVVLRDDKFKDLKFLGDRDVVRAGVRGQFPISQPIPIRPSAWRRPTTQPEIAPSSTHFEIDALGVRPGRP